MKPPLQEGSSESLRPTRVGKLRIRANQGHTPIATGGHTSNVLFRRMFDPRLTEEYQVAGEPYSEQTGDGELAAMAIGASLWSTANQTAEVRQLDIQGRPHRDPVGLWKPKSGCLIAPCSILTPGSSGLSGVDWQNAIMVHGDTVNASTMRWVAGHDFYNAALAYHGNPNRLDGGGPIWAILDGEAAVARQSWEVLPRRTWIRSGDWFFKADTIAELARSISNPYQTSSHANGSPGQETIVTYNSFVDSGTDEDFGKPTPRHKIQMPPFYAAWSTPILHDSPHGSQDKPRGPR